MALIGKLLIVFLSREPFFLRRSDNLAVHQKRRRGIVIKGGDAQDVTGT